MEKKYKKLKVVSYCQLPMCQYRVGLTEPRLRPLNRRPGGFPEDPVGGEGPAENRCCSVPVARMQRRLVFTCVYVACTCAMLSASQGVRLTSLSGLSKRRCPQHQSCPTTRRRSWRALYLPFACGPRHGDPRVWRTLCMIALAVLCCAVCLPASNRTWRQRRWRNSRKCWRAWASGAASCAAGQHHASARNLPLAHAAGSTTSSAAATSTTSSPASPTARCTAACPSARHVAAARCAFRTNPALDTTARATSAARDTWTMTRYVQ